MVKIAVDCMGGDIGLDVTLPAARSFLDANPSASVLLVGDETQIAHRWQSHPRAVIVHASEVITMDDSVEVALRKKKDSSIRVAVTQVKEGAADAALSAGNTGALMAVARYVLKTLDGIDRPAIAAQIPNCKGSATTMLDLGANVDCSPSHLLQFAVMGSALVSCLGQSESPSVGLLNVGEEVIKGNDTIKQAGELLRQASASGDLNFFGNVEGDDIFKGTTDIVVCDGFVGNVSLKTSEGLAAMISSILKEEFASSIFSKFAAICAQKVLKSFKNRVDHRKYNGAALLGLRGLVFKSHGSADVLAFENALKKVYDAADKQLLVQLQTRIAHAEPLLLSLDFSKT